MNDAGIGTSDEELKQYKIKAQTIATKVNCYFDELAKDKSIYETKFLPNPLKCFDMENLVNEKDHEKMNLKLKEVHSESTDTCRARLETRIMLMGISFTVLYAAAAYCIAFGMEGNPAAATMSALLAGIIGLLVSLTLVILVESILSSNSVNDLSLNLCRDFSH